ncbi:MAG: ACP S-malonyltransferase [Actinomycetota bacterium]|nr:ACP S-malonyltransferase [Actinomycetota bacterium]
MLAIVAPGQGAQKPGMLTPWLELDGPSARLDQWSDAAELDLRRWGTTADADEIKDTAITQPLVVASALLAAGRLDVPATSATAGHSIGELAAAAIAGVVTDVQAISLAGLRGRAMRAACALEPTSMAACMNPNLELILAALTARNLVGANVNGAGQVVAAGSAADIAAIAADPPEGIRVIPLQVAGAFHTRYMESAKAALAPRIAQLQPADPQLPLLTNSDGTVVDSGKRYLELVLRQITSPVRWDLCMATLSGLGVTGVLELPPAGTLVGLLKRDRKDIATMALKTPAELDAAMAFIAEHAGAAA